MHKEGMNWRGGQPYCKKRGKINKTAVSAAVGCGMIRVDPDMLRSVRAYCVLTSFCREKENSFCLEKGKCFAVRSAHESKVSVQLFQFTSGPDSPRVLHNDGPLFLPWLLLHDSEKSSFFRSHRHLSAN